MTNERPSPLFPATPTSLRNGSLQPESFAWIALVLTLIFTGGAWFIAERIVNHRIDERFLYRAEKERDFIVRRMQAYGDDAEAIRALGAEVVAQLCRRLLDGGAPGLHFYTLNRARATLAVIERLH